jgi:hypothetical protein
MSYDEPEEEKIRVYNDIDEEDIDSFEEFENIYSLKEPIDDEGVPKELSF